MLDSKSVISVHAVKQKRERKREIERVQKTKVKNILNDFCIQFLYLLLYSTHSSGKCVCVSVAGCLCVIRLCWVCYIRIFAFGISELRRV